MDSPELSRVVATAASLGAAASDATTFFSKPVLLTGERGALSTVNGRDCLQAALLLLLRMTTDLTVDISNHPSPGEIYRIVEEYRIHKITVTTEVPKPQAFAATLNVGTKTSKTAPIIAINSDGWLLRVTSGDVPISPDCSQENPVGALAAASIGVSEIFKILVNLKPGRGEPLQGYSFSLWEYALSNNRGPEFPHRIELPTTALFGCGAIGNGIVYLLQRFVKSGKLTLVDKEVFEEENLGTCLVMKPKDIEERKADVLCKRLPFANPFYGTVEAFKSDQGHPVPKICLNGLDNIEARRQVQELWPDLILDGALGPVSCEVTIHPWGPNLSCLMCDFEEPSTSAVKEATLVTGLTTERLRDQTATITEYDVEIAPDDKKEFLRARIGRQMCSVVSEAELEKLSKEKRAQRFRPSVPFVACLSASMIVVELVRYILNSKQVLSTGFQFDVLVGPHNGIRKDHARKISCLCVTRRSIIEKLRSARTIT